VTAGQPDGTPLLEIDDRAVGGFKRSSQHSDEMGCADGTTARMDDDDYGASGDAFAGQAADPA
jgi:hypothetical protein